METSAKTALNVNETFLAIGTYTLPELKYLTINCVETVE